MAFKPACPMRCRAEGPGASAATIHVLVPRPLVDSLTARAVANIAAADTAGECPIHPTSQDAAAEAAAGDIVEIVFSAGDDRFCRALAAADRGSDSFAKIAGRKTGGIAGEERIADAARERTPNVVTITFRLAGDGNPEIAQDLRGQMLPVLPDVLAALFQPRCHAAHSHIEPARSLGNVPTVARQAMLEEP